MGMHVQTSACTAPETCQRLGRLHDWQPWVQGNRNALAGIDILRKVCNHPDLLQRAQWQGSDEYGSPERSGKLTVALKVCCGLRIPSFYSFNIFVAGCRRVWQPRALRQALWPSRYPAGMDVILVYRATFFCSWGVR